MNSTITEQLEEKDGQIYSEDEMDGQIVIVCDEEKVEEVAEILMSMKTSAVVEEPKETRKTLIDWILQRRPDMKIKSKSKPFLLALKQSLIDQGWGGEDETSVKIAYLQTELEKSKTVAAVKSKELSKTKYLNTTLIKQIDDAEKKMVEMAIQNSTMAAAEPEMKPKTTVKALEALADLTNDVDDLCKSEDINDGARVQLCDKLMEIHKIINEDPDWQFEYFAGGDENGDY